MDLSAPNLSVSAKQRQETVLKQYDLCVVFPSDDGVSLTPTGENYINILHMNGLETLVYRGINTSEIYVLIRAGEALLRNFADDIDFPMLLDSNYLQDILSKGIPEHCIAPVEISHVEEVSMYKPYEYIYGKFSIRMPDELYAKAKPSDRSPFDNSIVRVKLTALLVEKNPPSGENIKMNKAINRLGTVKAYFPLHDPKELADLRQKWSGFPIIPWKQPYDDITKYFGEKISMYFIFLGHYSWWCVYASIVGVPLQIAVFALDDYSAPFLPFFAYFLALWGIMMLEFWKRTESEWAMKWGTLGFESTEGDRSDFEGVPIKSYVDGKDMMYFSSKLKARYMQQSLIGVIIFVAMVIGAISSIYFIRFSIQPVVGPYAQTIASCINAIQIQVASYLYNSLAVSLNDRENHRTETLYEDALIAKLFLFEFVNNYSSFCYLAFFAEIMNDCPTEAIGGCMQPLTINLAIIFITRLLSGNLMEFCIPYFSQKRRMKAVVDSAGGDMEVITRPELEFLLQPYDSHSASIGDFTELAIQYGYASMFASALPISPFLSLISNFVEASVDSWKLLHVHQRPQPYSCEDIGTWQVVFTIVSVASVVSNASLTVFTMTLSNSLSDFTRFWIYIGFQWTCFAIQGGIMYAVPDIPEGVTVQQDRTRFIVEKVIDQTPDDEVVRYVGDTNVQDENALVQGNPVLDGRPLVPPVLNLMIKAKSGKMLAPASPSRPTTAADLKVISKVNTTDNLLDSNECQSPEMPAKRDYSAPVEPDNRNNFTVLALVDTE